MPFGLTNTPAVFQALVNEFSGHLCVCLLGQYSNLPQVSRGTPDPCEERKQFTVEVDVGAGAVLSQRSGFQGKLQPCAFFSHHLSPTEKNYDVGDREILAIKLALNEWWHWLHGAELPFIIWTDHKNLTYLHTAKRLNPRQARWSLFFARFKQAPGTLNLMVSPVSTPPIQDPQNHPLSCPLNVALVPSPGTLRESSSKRFWKILTLAQVHLVDTSFLRLLRGRFSIGPTLHGSHAIQE